MVQARQNKKKTYRSVLLNGDRMDDPGAVLAFELEAGLVVVVVVVVLLPLPLLATAPARMDDRAEYFKTRGCDANSLAGFESFAVGATQLWSAGNRCDAQNSFLHFWRKC